MGMGLVMIIKDLGARPNVVHSLSSLSTTGNDGKWEPWPIRIAGGRGNCCLRDTAHMVTGISGSRLGREKISCHVTNVQHAKAARKSRCTA